MKKGCHATHTNIGLSQFVTTFSPFHSIRTVNMKIPKLRTLQYPCKKKKKSYNSLYTYNNLVDQQRK